MAQHEITLNVSLTNGTVDPDPSPIPIFQPGDEVIWKINGAALNQIKLIVGGAVPRVKLSVHNVNDAQQRELAWTTGTNGANIEPPPPPPGGVRTSFQ